MKCPYCAEEIKDEAIVCRFCGRDLALHLSSSRISTLEKTVEELKQSVTAFAAQPDSRPAGPRWAVLMVGTTVTVLLTAGSFWLKLNDFASAYVIVLMGSSAPLAVYLAFKNIHASIWRYISFGLVQAAATTLTLGALVSWRYPGRRLDFMPYAFFELSIVDGLLFLSVSLFRRYLKQARGGGVRSSASASSSTENRWKHLSEITTALAPVLALIGSIVAAYIGYLAAVAKAGAK